MSPGLGSESLSNGVIIIETSSKVGSESPSATGRKLTKGEVWTNASPSAAKTSGRVVKNPEVSNVCRFPLSSEKINI